MSTEVAAPAAGGPTDRPPRTWWPMLWWTAGPLGLVALLGLFGWLLVAPFLQARDVLWESDANGCALDAETVLARLGGTDAAARKLSLLIRTPEWLYIKGRHGLPVGQERRKLRTRAWLALTACGRPGVNGLISLLESRDASVRIGAARALGLTGADCAMAANALLRALADVEPEVRCTAAADIGNLGLCSELFRDTLIRALDDSDTMVRRQAAWALGRMGTKGRVAAAALERAARSPDEHLRPEAAEALYRVTGDRDKLIAKLSNDMNSTDRIGIAAIAVWKALELGPAAEEPISKALANAREATPLVYGESELESLRQILAAAQQALREEPPHRITPEIAWRLGRKVYFEFDDSSRLGVALAIGRAADIPVDTDLLAAPGKPYSTGTGIMPVANSMLWVCLQTGLNWQIHDGKLVAMPPPPSR